MRNLRRYSLAILVLLSLTALVSCNQPKVTILNIYTINDFHGALIQSGSDIPGISRIGKYLKDMKAANPEGTIILSAGDMFQGSALSNLEKGRYVVDAMNDIGFDAMTIGNHEFDWGLGIIESYEDGDQNNGEAAFPFLGSNIIDKATSQRVSFLADYVIIDRGDLKIGIIGSIGSELESDIATPMIEDYDLVDPVPIIGDIATDLRVNKGVNVVIADLHEAQNFINNGIANLSGDAAVDAIVNGHAHGTTADLLSVSDGREIPVVQAGSSGSHIGQITLEVDKKTKQVQNPKATLKTNYTTMPEDPKLKAYIDQKITETEPIFGRVIGTAGEIITKNLVCDWAPDLLKNVYGGDIGVINDGGIRKSAFNINLGQAITVNKMFEIMPFDNAIKYANLTGAQVRALLRNTDNGLVFSDNVNKLANTIDGVAIEDGRTYKVITIDYVFDKTELPFINGTDITVPGVLYRDVMIAEIERVTQSGQSWIPSQYNK